MNGNITREGITADLEAMKQIGLGGATIVNVDCDIPRGKVPFMSPEWRQDFKFAVQEADRLGLKLCVENCAGWSSSGGPWVTPAEAMQCLTSSETNIQGPVEFDAVLPHPPEKLGFYREVAVLAFQNSSEPKEKPAPVKPAPKGRLEVKRAVYGAEGGGSIDVTDKIAATVRSGRRSLTVGNSEMGLDPAINKPKQLTVDFVLDGKPITVTVDEGNSLTIPPNAHQRQRSRTDAERTFVNPPLPLDDPGNPIPHDQVLDLTSKFSADGRLHWKVPAGNWTILRLGYTPTGVENHPAPTEGLGLECDKLSKSALDAHWNGFMQKVLDDLGPLGGKTLDCSLIDSYEVGNQDWTEQFRQEFTKRRGYDPLKYLPTFTRRVVDNPEVTDRFLWDVRRTVSDLFAENYYDHFAQLCKQHGLQSAIEPYTGPFESMPCGAPADVVMGEFWTGSQGHSSIKLAASIAHVYGKKIVAAESFTASPEAGRWQNDPYAEKTLGDLMYCQGLNRYVFHRYAMQPWTNRWPGMTMGQWGIHFERTETWWNQGKAWIDYISHCEFLLQQGRAVEDAAYFNGQTAPSETRTGNPPLPAGYDSDAVDADALLHGATVRNGRITLASGANYAFLVLPPDDPNMTPEMLRCLRDLVRAGATIVGPRPDRSPSLNDYPKCDAQVKKFAGEMWGPCDGKTVFEHADGKGRVIWGKQLSDVFAEQNLKPDFESTSKTRTSRISYAHRIADGADIYFVSNQRREFDSVECTFRVDGKIPELWHPDTGVIEPAAVWSSENGRTKVRLDLDPAGSVFVVFRHAANTADHVVSIKNDVLAPPPSNSTLSIQHAVYGATDGAGEMDVTAKVASMISDGQLIVTANNATFERDPAVLHGKRLSVDYTLDGKPGHAVAEENGMLMIPQEVPVPTAPASREVLETADGSINVRSWTNEEVHLVTSGGKALQTHTTGLPAPGVISGAWALTFPPNWGAPPSITLDKLISWTDDTNSGVRYFSGTATYEKEIEIPAERLADGREVWLDLGNVKNFAEVSLNGQSFGVLWKPPFRVNVTSAAKSGSNRLLVKITNLWPNRLIGDEQLPPDRDWAGKQLRDWPQWLLEGKPSPTGRITFTTWHHWTKDSPLLPSGLLGPVMLESAVVQPAK